MNLPKNLFEQQETEIGERISAVRMRMLFLISSRL